MARVQKYISIKVSEELTFFQLQVSPKHYACSNVSDKFAASVLIGVQNKLFLLLE